MMNTWLSQLKPEQLIWPLLALCLVVFAQAVGFGFTSLDDSKHIWSNPYVSNLSLDNLWFFWREAYYGLYVPVIYNTWAFLSSVSQHLLAPHEITKYSAVPFHAFNLLIHLCNVWLVFHIVGFLLSLQKDLPEELRGLGRFIVTLPFAIHPLQVEPVVWVSGLKDVLMGFFLFLSTCFYLRLLVRQAQKNNRRKGSKKHKSRLLVQVETDSLPTLFTAKLPLISNQLEPLFVLFFFALSLLTKPAAVILLPFLATLHWFYFPTQWKSKIPLLTALTTLGLVLVFWTKSLQPSSRLDFDYHLLLQLQTILASIGFYLVKMILPLSLAPDYGLTPEKLAEDTWLLAYIFIGVLVVFLGIWGGFKRNTFGFAALLFLLGVCPVVGIIPFEYQNISTVADRYVYTFTQLGFGLLAFASLCHFNKQGLKAFTLIAALSLTIISASQVRHWRNNKALFSRVLQVNPGSHLAYNNLGIHALRNGHYEEAKNQLIKATQLKKNYYAAENNLGVVYFKQKDFAKVISYYSEVLKKYPDKSAGDPATFADMHYNLGAALVNTGALAESVGHLKKAIEINALYFKAHYHLARVLFHLKRFEEGKQAVSAAYRLNPNHPGLNELIQQVSLTMSTSVQK